MQRLATKANYKRLKTIYFISSSNPPISSHTLEYAHDVKSLQKENWYNGNFYLPVTPAQRHPL